MSEFVRVPKEPTKEMIAAGRAAVMARDCSSYMWTARNHYEESGNDANLAATPAGLLDERGKIDKAGGAMLVWYAMCAAAPSPEVRTGEEGPEPLTEEQMERLRLLCTFAMVVGDPSRDSDRELIEAAYRIADHYRNQCAQGKEG